MATKIMIAYGRFGQVLMNRNAVRPVSVTNVEEGLYKISGS